MPGRIGIALVAFGEAGIIVWKQVDRLEARAADGPKQVILSSQHGRILWIAEPPGHFRDADR